MIQVSSPPVKRIFRVTWTQRVSWTTVAAGTTDMLLNEFTGSYIQHYFPVTNITVIGASLYGVANAGAVSAGSIGLAIRKRTLGAGDAGDYDLGLTLNADSYRQYATLYCSVEKAVITPGTINFTPSDMLGVVLVRAEGTTTPTNAYFMGDILFREN